jgi:hypothetical protein
VLLQKENHIPVLLTAFFFLLVVIPGYIYYTFGGKLRLDEFGVHTDNRKIIGTHLNENFLIKQMPALIGRTIEMQSL